MISLYDPKGFLPAAEELPDSDGAPVDNELQNVLPNLLLTLLGWIWRDRRDWFFAVDMGVYYNPDEPPMVPDGLLSLGVDRKPPELEDGRLSYVLWEENGVIPVLFLEVVSKSRGGEYSRKKRDYAALGVRYYAIYNSKRKRKARLEVHQLEGHSYVSLAGTPAPVSSGLEGNYFWLPEIGLGLGRGQGVHMGWPREWLYWCDQSGKRFLTPEERVEQMAAKLRELGVNPDVF